MNTEEEDKDNSWEDDYDPYPIEGDNDYIAEAERREQNKLMKPIWIIVSKDDKVVSAFCFETENEAKAWLTDGGNNFLPGDKPKQLWLTNQNSLLA